MSDELTLSDAERTAGIVRCDACPVLCRIRPGVDMQVAADQQLVRALGN